MHGEGVGGVPGRAAPDHAVDGHLHAGYGDGRQAHLPGTGAGTPRGHLDGAQRRGKYRVTRPLESYILLTSN